MKMFRRLSCVIYYACWFVTHPVLQTYLKPKFKKYPEQLQSEFLVLTQLSFIKTIVMGKTGETRVQDTGRTKVTGCVAQRDFSPELEIPF